MVMPDLQRYIYNRNQIKKDNAIFLTQKVFTFVTFSIDFYIQEMRKSLSQRTANKKKTVCVKGHFDITLTVRLRRCMIAMGLFAVSQIN